jgi:hypothetical protein
LSYVRNFVGYRPGERDDGLPWTTAKIYEAPDVSGAPGSWTLIDTITLSPVDTDPTEPAVRNLTTTHATLTVGWYRVIFTDAAGDQELTTPVAYPPVDTPYFTPAEIRARYSALANTTTYPDATIDARRLEVEERLERLCDVAFVPRVVTGERVSGNGSTRLEVKHTKLRAITAATDSGATVDLTDAVVAGDTFYLAAGWTQGVSNLTVTYTHGYDSPPPAVKEAAMLWVRELLIKGPVTDRRTQIPTEDGGVINLATPGLFGSLTGIPAVDEIISEYRHLAFVG